MIWGLGAASVACNSARENERKNNDKKTAASRGSGLARISETPATWNGGNGNVAALEQFTRRHRFAENRTMTGTPPSISCRLTVSDAGGTGKYGRDFGQHDEFVNEQYFDA
jgi:hypothetical protein